MDNLFIMLLSLFFMFLSGYTYALLETCKIDPQYITRNKMWMIICVILSLFFGLMITISK